jgi:hypothetical protein
VLAPPEIGRNVVGMRTTTGITQRLPFAFAAKNEIGDDARAHRDERQPAAGMR